MHHSEFREFREHASVSTLASLLLVLDDLSLQFMRNRQQVPQRPLNLFVFTTQLSVFFIAVGRLLRA